MHKWNEHEWDNLQHININNQKAYCKKCGTYILDIGNFIYLNKTRKESLYWEELCECKMCHNNFVLHYDIFDSKGHIYSRIFTEDVNNIKYNWQELLNDEQKELISKHLTNCLICRDRLANEILTDAWFRSLMQELRLRS